VLDSTGAVRVDQCIPEYDDSALFFFSPLKRSHTDVPTSVQNYSLTSDLIRLQISALPYPVVPSAYGSMYLDLRTAQNALNNTLIKPVLPSHVLNFTSQDVTVTFEALNYARVTIDWRKVDASFAYGTHFKFVLYGQDHTAALPLPPGFTAGSLAGNVVHL